MRKIDHPNIVKLVDFSEARQYYYIILELCPGGELFHQIVRLTYFSEDLSRHVIVQVAKALEYLHEEAGVVHRYVSHRSAEEEVVLMTVGISNRKISFFTAFHSFPPKFLNPSSPMTRTRLTKASSSKALVRAESV